jgi:hypothetical protein
MRAVTFRPARGCIVARLLVRPPIRADVLHLAFVLITACFRVTTGCPSGRPGIAPHRTAWQTPTASTVLAMQNSTKSLSSWRTEYVSGVADRTPAAQNITSLFVRPRTLSAATATRCGHLRLRSLR